MICIYYYMISRYIMKKNMINEKYLKSSDIIVNLFLAYVAETQLHDEVLINYPNLISE